MGELGEFWTLLKNLQDQGTYRGVASSASDDRKLETQRPRINTEAFQRIVQLSLVRETNESKKTDVVNHLLKLVHQMGGEARAMQVPPPIEIPQQWEAPIAKSPSETQKLLTQLLGKRVNPAPTLQAKDYPTPSSPVAQQRGIQLQEAMQSQSNVSRFFKNLEKAQSERASEISQQSETERLIRQIIEQRDQREMRSAKSETSHSYEMQPNAPFASRAPPVAPTFTAPTPQIFEQSVTKSTAIPQYTAPAAIPTPIPDPKPCAIPTPDSCAASSSLPPTPACTESELDAAISDVMARYDLFDAIHKIYGVPASPAESDIIEKAFFEIEYAYWFYCDYHKDNNPSLPKFTLKSFAEEIFKRSPSFHKSLGGHGVDYMHDKFLDYKSKIPKCGAILLNDNMDKILLVNPFYSNGWQVPRGKLGESETPREAALREVLEETGYDAKDVMTKNEGKIAKHVKGAQFNVTLFLTVGVPEDYPFMPQTRKEIKAIEWHDLHYLFSLYPNRNETEAKEKLKPYNHIVPLLPKIGMLVVLEYRERRLPIPEVVLKVGSGDIVSQPQVKYRGETRRTGSFKKEYNSSPIVSQSPYGWNTPNASPCASSPAVNYSNVKNDFSASAPNTPQQTDLKVTSCVEPPRSTPVAETRPPVVPPSPACPPPAPDTQRAQPVVNETGKKVGEHVTPMLQQLRLLAKGEKEPSLGTTALNASVAAGSKLSVHGLPGEHAHAAERLPTTKNSKQEVIGNVALAKVSNSGDTEETAKSGKIIWQRPPPRQDFKFDVSSIIDGLS